MQHDIILYEEILVTALMLVLVFIFYLIGLKIAGRKKYDRYANVYFSLFLGALASLIFFYIHNLTRYFTGYHIEYFSGISLIFIPISFLSSLIFGILFLKARKKFRDKSL